MNRSIKLLLVFSCALLCLLAFTKDCSKKFVLNDDPIDVVIPCCKKDLSTLELAISGIKKHGQNIRRVIVVSSEKLTSHAEWFDEKLFPFAKGDIAYILFKGNQEEITKYLESDSNRSGWLLQQLIKLYAPFVIPDISSNVLVLDSDTIFTKDVSFISSDGKTFFTPASEHHRPYFIHAEKLLPTLKRKHAKISGIAHHMLLQRDVLSSLFNEVESLHKKEFWRVFLEKVDPLEGAGASEYEIYFNYFISRSNQYQIRPLKWKNGSSLAKFERAKKKYDYISLHRYSRVDLPLDE